VILVDANLLIYAYVPSLPEHQAAGQWLEQTLNETERVGLPWASLLAFLRVTTSLRIVGPSSLDESWDRVCEWLDHPAVWIPGPTERHRRVLGELLSSGAAVANLVPDAHLAALAIEHGLTLCSTDRDFARFPGLRWENPIAAGR